MSRGAFRAWRPRYGRISAAGSAFVVTAVTLLGGIGVLPTTAPAPAAASSAASSAAKTIPDRTSTAPSDEDAGVTLPGTLRSTGRDGAPAPAGVPARSGQGRRVVFDISAQRVWLVDRSGGVERTYLVSGSLTHNLGAGSYEVYSTSRWAVGVDDSGVMQYFVRFTRGARAAIGFHSIPTKDGRLLQSRDQLGTPQSHGCIRQALPDARAMWDFAPVGTKVVVVA